MASKDLVNEIIGDRFLVGDYVAGGSFGTFHFGYERQTGEKVGIKLESREVTQQQLVLEYYFYQSLGVLKGKSPVGFLPRIYYFGPVTGSKWHGLVMELLGPSLKDMRTIVNDYSIQTICLMTYQLMKIFMYCHELGIIYRDIKPENFLIGMPNTDKWWTVYLIGLAKRYIEEDQKHIPFTKGKLMTATMRYASINSHKNFEVSRRDDLEALLYMMVFLYKGELPWQGLTGQTQAEKSKQMEKIKENTSPAEICSSMPPAFAEVLQIVRQYKFEERPNYGLLNNYFYEALIHLGTTYEARLYDWNREHKPVANKDRGYMRRPSGNLQ